MTWITASLIVAALGLVNVIDSHLITRRMPSLRAYLLPASILHIAYGLIFFNLYPLPSGVPAFVWFIAAIAALTRTIAILLMLKTMCTEEISRVIPVAYIYPVFVAILAVPLLGETLNWLQWVAIFITVAGAVLISVRWRGQKGLAQLRQSFVLLFASSILFGVSNVATKYALDYLSFWNMYSISDICYGTVFFLFSARPGVLKELRDMAGRGTALKLMVLNETMTLGGYLLSFWAMANGPVSLASTVMGTRPCFVFLYTLLLSRVFKGALLEEYLNKGIIVVKIVSIGLIVGGVAIINLVETP
jgi:drug/metabolite transporter (DMT)-like permease